MNSFIALFSLIANLNATSYTCPEVTKPFLEELLKQGKNSNVQNENFLGSINTKEQMDIIEKTLSQLPNLEVTLLQDPDEIAVCEYGSNLGSFYVLSCPMIRPDDIQSIYNNNSGPITFDGLSKEALKPIINNKAVINQPATFLYNTYNGTSNSCRYNIEYQEPNSPKSYLWVTAILSPKI